MTNSDDIVYVTRQEFMESFGLSVNRSHSIGSGVFAEKRVEVLYQQINEQRTMLLPFNQ